MLDRSGTLLPVRCQRASDSNASPRLRTAHTLACGSRSDHFMMLYPDLALNSLLNVFAFIALELALSVACQPGLVYLRTPPHLYLTCGRCAFLQGIVNSSRASPHWSSGSGFHRSRVGCGICPTMLAGMGALAPSPGPGCCGVTSSPTRWRC